MEPRGGPRSSLYRVADHYISPVWLRPLVKDGVWTDAMEQRGGQRCSLYRVADHYISPVWLRPLVKDGV